MWWLTLPPNPERRPTVQDKTIRRVVIFFLVIAGVFVVVAYEAVRNISRSVASNDWVNHTHAVILQAEAVRSSVLVGDGALHTYVLTGDPRDLRAAREALSNVGDNLEIAKALTRNEPPQNQEVLKIEASANSRAEFVQGVLAARQSGEMVAVRTMLAADAGGTAIRDLQRTIDKLRDDELSLLTERDTASFLQAQTTRWTVWAGVALDVLLLLGASWLIRDDIASRRHAANALQEANAQLEGRVRERTADLTQANTKLSSENLERRWAHQALEHQLRYNHLIVDSINDLVLVLTKALNISRVNPAVVHLTGLEPSELVNQPLERVVRLAAAPGAAPTLRDPIAQALADGRDLRDLDAVVEDRQGRQTRVRLSLFPLRDRDKVVGGVVTLHFMRPAP
jgi:CHASE3 domain sensor protein